MNDSPVGCQTRAVTEPQRDGGICEANDGEVVKTVTFKPLSRARKERAPGIPRDMMRGKSRQAAAAPLMNGEPLAGDHRPPANLAQHRGFRVSFHTRQTGTGEQCSSPTRAFRQPELPAVGFCSLLRFPHRAAGLGRPLRSATAAPKNPPCFRRRRRSDF